VQVNGSVTCWK